ncbi:MAG: hypothetical protein ABL934_10200 [Lysobacteraceae bacterium]
MTACLACTDDTLPPLAEALAADDIDRALTLGLLAFESEENPGVCAECRARMRIVIAARNERLRVLAARERYRAREVRLAARAEARDRKRRAAATLPSAAAPSLPPAAAAALARAKARAAAKPASE